MGRWLEAVRRDEKNTKALLKGTDKTDETSRGGVLSVSSARQMSKSENFPSDGESAPGGSVGFVGPVPEDSREKNSAPNVANTPREVAPLLVATATGFKLRRPRPAVTGPTDQFCFRCGDYAESGWPSPDGRVLWVCNDCVGEA